LSAVFNKQLTASRLQAMKINASRLSAVTKTAKRLVAGRARYEGVERLTGVPWWFVAALHERESGGDFKTYLGNGQPLNRVTTLVPKGRGPWSTFEAGAVDALEYEGYTKVSDWSIEHALWLAEKYNGLGYANKGLPSPYIWGATNIQRPGKYREIKNSSGVYVSRFFPLEMDTQIGVAPMLQIISALVGGIIPGLIGNVINATTSTAGVNVPKSSAAGSMFNVAIGAILTGLGSTGFGVDAIHTITTLAGVAVAILSSINHLGLISESNANTEALVEQLLTQIANYEPPIPEVKSETPPAS